MNADTESVAFATLRVSGDELEPSAVTEALGLKPSLSYRKGETYRAGRRRQRDYVGQTGVWYLSTDDLLVSGRLEDHITFLSFLLAARPQGLERVHAMVLDGACEASASCFWAGPPGSTEPDISLTFRDLIARMGGRIEIDFQRDIASRNRAEFA